MEPAASPGQLMKTAPAIIAFLAFTSSALADDACTKSVKLDEYLRAHPSYIVPSEVRTRILTDCFCSDSSTVCLDRLTGFMDVCGFDFTCIRSHDESEKAKRRVEYCRTNVCATEIPMR
jgi:hypothetical protein